MVQENQIIFAIYPISKYVKHTMYYRIDPRYQWIGSVWMGLVLGDMRICPISLVLSVSLHHRRHGNVAPVWECWAPEISVCTQPGALVFRKIRRPWSDIKVLLYSVAPLCDLVTASSRGTLKCYTALKVRFLTLCYTPSVFTGNFQTSHYELIVRDSFGSLFESALLVIYIKYPVAICLPWGI